MMMKAMGKGFYVLDLLVLAFLMVCINHTGAFAVIDPRKKHVQPSVGEKGPLYERLSV